MPTEVLWSLISTRMMGHIVSAYHHLPGQGESLRTLVAFGSTQHHCNLAIGQFHRSAAPHSSICSLPCSRPAMRVWHMSVAEGTERPTVLNQVARSKIYCWILEFSGKSFIVHAHDTCRSVNSCNPYNSCFTPSVLFHPFVHGYVYKAIIL
jgi:hypothetical protein